jgi:hypothetical protein
MRYFIVISLKLFHHKTGSYHIPERETRWTLFEVPPIECPIKIYFDGIGLPGLLAIKSFRALSSQHLFVIFMAGFE